MISFETLFQQGVNFTEYTQQGTDAERASVNKVSNILKSKLLSDSLLKRLSSVATPVHLLIVGEMWCPDCQLNITAMQQMSVLQPKIQLAIISKEMAELQLYKLINLSQIKIPLVAILNKNYQLIGSFTERPKSVTEVENFIKIKDDYLAGNYLENTIGDVLDSILIS